MFLQQEPVVLLLDYVDADYGCNDPREERVTATLMRSYGEATAGLAPFRLGVSPLQTSHECDGLAIGTG